jgi:hypothetical protein
MEKIDKRNIKQFNGERYSIWKFRVKSLLRELNILHAVEDAIPDLPDEHWLKADSTARGVIVDYLSDAFLSFAKEVRFAKTIFDQLDAIYERRSLATQLAARKRLLSLKLEGDQTLIAHFNTFEEIITELTAAGAKLDEMDKVSHLLLTLPSTYDGLITALETLNEDNLNLTFVKNRLLDYEVKIKGDGDNATSTKILSVSVPGSSGSNQNFSFHKKNAGHFKYKPQKGFKKNGHKNKFKSGRQYKCSNLKCDHCGRTNHMKKDCCFYKRMIEKGDRPRTIQSIQTNVDSANQGFIFMIGSTEYQSETNDDNQITFILDSGATDHIINNDGVFTEFHELSPPINIAVAKTNTSVIATKRGTVKVKTNRGHHGTLEDVLYCPDVPYNLLSVRRMQEKGMTTIFDAAGVTIKNGDVTILTGKPFNGLTAVKIKACKNMVNLGSQSVINNNYKIWHERLGHISKQKFIQLKTHKMIDDINHLKLIKPTDNICEACIYGKQSRLPFAKAKVKNHEKRPLFIIHTDVCGPIKPSTVDGKNYFVTFIDDFTHYTVVYLITYKSDVFPMFKDFVAKCEAHFNLKIVNLYCDNGREYLSNEYKDFCSQKGITYHLTVSHTPQQNGISERMNRTITERARTMVIAADLNKALWGEAVLTAVNLINISPTKALEANKTPYELWHNKKPKIQYLRVFGSTVCS